MTEAQARVAAIAQEWIGTPFHHGARIKGVGVDCAQFLAAVFEEAGVVTPDLPEYSIDWFLHEDTERYLEGLAPYTTRVPDGEPMQVGDIPLFRFGRSISHAGIITALDVDGYPVMVHAFRSLGVTMDTLSPTGNLTARLARVHRITRWMA